MLKKIQFSEFTAFENLEIPFSQGVNVFVGENGTGKTHVLKAAYAACDITRTDIPFATKINDVFLPSEKKIGRLTRIYASCRRIPKIGAVVAAHTKWNASKRLRSLLGRTGSKLKSKTNENCRRHSA